MKRFLAISLKILFIFAATSLAWFSVSAAIVAVCAAILAVLHPKLDALIEISFGPLKAKLQREVSEAEKLLQGLKGLALVQAKSAISIGARTGRWASQDDWNYNAVRELEAALRLTGADEEMLKDARTDFVKFTNRDLAYCTLGGAYVPMYLGQDAVQEYQENQKSDAFLDPEFLESWLRKWEAYSPEREERVNDMRWLRDHGDVRDRDQYMRAQIEVPWPGNP